MPGIRSIDIENDYYFDEEYIEINGTNIKQFNDEDNNTKIEKFERIKREKLQSLNNNRKYSKKLQSVYLIINDIKFSNDKKKSNIHILIFL